jgi:hypothetical protein
MRQVIPISSVNIDYLEPFPLLHHETLQKPAIFEVTPTERWPLGWRPTSTTGELKTLAPVYNLKGNFSSITVLPCPQCGHVLRGLGKGIPVVCLECGFPSHEHGWRREK